MPRALLFENVKSMVIFQALHNLDLKIAKLLRLSFASNFSSDKVITMTVSGAETTTCSMKN